MRHALETFMINPYYSILLQPQCLYIKIDILPREYYPRENCDISQNSSDRFSNLTHAGQYHRYVTY